MNARHRAACDHRLADHPTGLPCDRGAHAHDPDGHTYSSRDVADKHTDSEAQED